MERVEDLMKVNHPCCSSSAYLQEACRVFTDNECSEVFILDDEKRLIGAVSERDVLSKCVSGVDPLRVKVTDYMHEVPIVINAKMELEDCLTVLEHNKVELAPVVDDRGHYCGLINLNDILADFKE